MILSTRMDNKEYLKFLLTRIDDKDYESVASFIKQVSDLSELTEVKIKDDLENHPYLSEILKSRLRGILIKLRNENLIDYSLDTNIKELYHFYRTITDVEFDSYRVELFKSLSYFSINIVYTEFLNGSSILSNTHLIDSLKVLVSDPRSAGLNINILLNGKESVNHRLNLLSLLHFESEVFYETYNTIIYKSGVVVTLIPQSKMTKLGKSREAIEKVVPSDFYINVDEDDFFYPEGVLNILENSHKLSLDKPTAIIFNWIYVDKEGEVRFKINPYKDKLEKGSYLNSLIGLSSWNLINPYYLYTNKLGIERPNMNKYDDSVFYNRLYSRIKEVDFIPEVVYGYCHLSASMSTTEELTDLDVAIREITKDAKPFKLARIVGHEDSTKEFIIDNKILKVIEKHHKYLNYNVKLKP